MKRKCDAAPINQISFPNELVHLIISHINHLDVASLNIMAQVSHQALQWIRPQLMLLFEMALRVHEIVYSPTRLALRSNNPGFMLALLPYRIDCEYSRGLALFFQRHPDICRRFSDVDFVPHPVLDVVPVADPVPGTHRHLLGLLYYASLQAEHLIVPPPADKRRLLRTVTEQEQQRLLVESVQLISDQKPGCATRISDVLCRLSDDPASEVFPLSMFANIKAVRTLAPGQESREREMMQCIAAESDPNQREMMQYYAQKKGTAREKRAQYYAVTRARHSVVNTDPRKDCFQDLVMQDDSNAKHWVHLFSPGAQSFLNRCFLKPPPSAELDEKRVMNLLRFEPQHVKRCCDWLDAEVLAARKRACIVITDSVNEISID
jgi:hypothetical protein